jgi:hypothetical protein
MLSIRGVAARGSLTAKMSGLLSASAALTIISSSPAFGAQGPDPARVAALGELRIDAEPTRSTLTNRDPAIEGRHYDDWRLHLMRGDTVQIDMESSAFDSYLELWKPGTAAALADNDDIRYGVLDSRLIFSAPEEADYVVRAQHLYTGTGAYALSVRRVASTARTLALAPDRPITGTLDRDSAVVADPARVGSGLRYDEYVFQAAAGDRVRIDMTSGSLDPRLHLLTENGTVIETDNNGGDGFNSRIVAVLPPPGGSFRVRAAAPTEQTGGYELQLRLARATPPEIPELRANGPAIDADLGGPTAAVRLRPGERARVDYFYHLYTLQVRAGETVTVTMHPTGFTAVLEAGTMSRLGFAVAETDDDNERGEDAQLVLTPPAGGRIHIRARGAGSNTGPYTLRVTTIPPPARARAR